MAGSQAGGSPALLLTGVGLALVLAGIWLPVESGGDSFWDSSFSGHALGILMLLLVLLTAVLVVGSLSGRGGALGEATLLVAAVTFGLVEAEWIAAAFDNLGSLGSGAWIEAIGGLSLIVGVAGLRVAGPWRGTAEHGSPAAAPAP